VTSVETEHPVLAIPPGVDPPGASLAQVLRPGRRSLGAFTLAGLVVAVALLVVLPRPHAGAVRPIDPTRTIERAKLLATLPVYVPASLPAGWVVDSVNLDAGKGRERLDIGYQAPDFGYVGLVETSAVRWRAIVSQSTAGGRPEDYVTINGQLWARLLSTRRALQSLVWYGPHSEVIVAGTTTLANLEQFATSLNIS
jgi:Protein of unknown function (DUF4245)